MHAIDAIESMSPKTKPKLREPNRKATVQD